MIISFFRAVIIYLCVIVGLRFMGKRQIGEMQPTELVITLLISETASIPLDDIGTPLSASLIPVTVLICLEIIISGINMKSLKFRRLFTGSPVIVIENGNIMQKSLKDLRMSVTDLLDALREQGAFEISKVKYAILETNGKLSVMLKDSENPVSVSQMKIEPPDEKLPFIVVSDGKIVTAHLKQTGVSINDIHNEAKRQKLKVKDILLMTADNDKNYYTIKRDENI